MKSNTIIAGDFKTPLSTMDKPSRNRINKEVDVNNIIGQMDLRGLYRTFYSTQQNAHYFRAYMEHFLKVS